MFLAVILVPELFKKLREICGSGTDDEELCSLFLYLRKIDSAYILRRLLIVLGGANNESRGGPGGPGTGFWNPGAGGVF